MDFRPQPMMMIANKVIPLIFLFGMLLILGSACQPHDLPPGSDAAAVVPSEIVSTRISPSAPPQVSPTAVWTYTPDIRPSLTPSLTPTIAPTVAPSPSPTQTATQFNTPTSTPTYSILRGTVLEQANCRYGPGAAYLYKYGLYPDNTLEIIGRNEPGNWVMVQAIGGSNPCWIKASLMDIHGEVMTLAPAALPLPQSPFYGPVTGVASSREGDQVVISWDPINLRAGDDSLQYPYLIEAWLCQDGQLSFSAIGSWETIVTVTDEPGCKEPSHAVIYGVEKHGYTRWVAIPWTQP